MTIRTRLTLWYSSLLASVIIVFSVSLFSLLNWTWREQLLDTMRTAAKAVLTDIKFDHDTGSITTRYLPTKLSSLIYSPLAIQVWRLDGTLAATNVPEFPAAFDQQSMNVADAQWREIDYDGVRMIAYTQPVLNWSNEIVGVVQVLGSLESLNETLSRLVRLMIAVSVVALVLSFMVGSVIAAQALQPIDLISNAAREIAAADDLSKRIPYEGPPDELGQLTNTFNATLERLERLFLVQRRFVADVSHELRTPLTTIQGNLDLMRRMGDDPISRAAIEGEVKRMTRLVGDLLLLAQADSGRMPLRETVVDLDSLVLEVYNETKLIAEGVDLKIDMLEPVRVRGDGDRLKQLLLNLVTNALKYTPVDGKVSLNLKKTEGYAYLSVTDTGIGIPKEDLPHIFDRFYRVDKARDRKMGGFGLGLSIASWIVEAHRGRIWAESEVGKGSTFIVQLPAYAEDIPDSAKETRIRIPTIRRTPVHNPPAVQPPGSSTIPSASSRGDSGRSPDQPS
ncbi:MAG: ATP-binding protein [Anaerolineae bacterium]|nr:HAMP domain-containing protein [Anaerolineae bacterium]